MTCLAVLIALKDNHKTATIATVCSALIEGSNWQR